MAKDGEEKSVSEAPRVHLCVAPLPAWLDLARLLGTGFSRVEGTDAAEAMLPAKQAAEVCARLRGLGIDGSLLSVQVTPPLARALVRAARLDDARARRETTPAFLRAGVRVSGEGRYSLTPEALAMSLAQDTGGKRVVDACCGSGGNAIAFARAGCAVTAIELDGERLAEAEHNARVYGVAQRIRFLHGDACELVPTLTCDLLFIDPPWGRDYDKRASQRADFPLLDRLLSRVLDRPAQFGALWLKLPASFAMGTLPGPWRAQAVFGEGRGDFRRIKFILAAQVTEGPAL